MLLKYEKKRNGDGSPKSETGIKASSNKLLKLIILINAGINQFCHPVFDELCPQIDKQQE